MSLSIGEMSFSRIFVRSFQTTRAALSFPSTKWGFTPSNPFIPSKGRLTKNRIGILLTIKSSMSSSMSQALPAERVLEGTNDYHGGVTVELTSEPQDPVVFVSLLKASLSYWRQQGKRSIWIKIPIELVNLVEPAVKEGFYFHHAEPKYLMLVQWLPAAPNTLPANASHRVGIGAFVLNEKNEVLVVQEKSGKFRGTGVWKFPTGVVDEGEDICDAAVREVKEETGIDSKFLEILAFRQSHQSFFDKSDMFFVCMMQPLSVDIQPQEAEIEAAQWMPYEEYVAQPFIQKHDLLVKISDVCAAKRDGKYSGFSPLPSTTGFSQKDSFLYVNTRAIDSSHSKI